MEVPWALPVGLHEEKCDFCGKCLEFYPKDIYLDKIFELLSMERPAREYERINALCCGQLFSYDQYD